MTHPRIRHALQLIAAPAMVVLVIAFYFRVASVNNTTVALTLLLVIFGISTCVGAAGGDHRVAGRSARIQLLLPAAGRHIRGGDPQNWVALIAFLVTAVMASQLSARAKRRTLEAVERRREVEGLYALSQSLLLSGSARTASQDLVSRVVRILGVTTRRLPRQVELTKRSAGGRTIP